MTRILILNRRDIKNPIGGGAEVYTHEAAKGLRDRGAEVTVFSSRYPDAPPDETVEGVDYHREGNEFTVHFKGFLYALRNRKRFDLIIDEFNGMGFFTFLLPRGMVLIHQLYKEFWLRELGLAGFLPYIIEPVLLKCYKRRAAITVSESTKADLSALGFRRVDIVMNALDVTVLRDVPEKENAPTLLFLGRLKSTKRPEDALKIFEAVKKELPDARLWVVGSGPMETELKEKASRLERVVFWGRIDDARKFELLRRAHVLLVPGVREGFGINVIEAASQGTPAVGYNIHGLRDSIRDGQTGLLADGVEDAAKKTVSLLKDGDLYRRLAKNCLDYARGFDWKKRAEEFHRAVVGIMEKTDRELRQ